MRVQLPELFQLSDFDRGVARNDLLDSRRPSEALSEFVFVTSRSNEPNHLDARPIDFTRRDGSVTSWIEASS